MQHTILTIEINNNPIIDIELGFKSSIVNRQWSINTIDMGNNGHVLRRSRTDKMVAGVCGGLASYLGLDSTLVRIAYVLLSIFTVFAGLFVYLLLWLVMPNEN
jgi:phage shock protein PspC (stress-responsive transcriptional regulator)